MPGFESCLGCEFRSRPEVCHALATGHARFCTLVHELGRDDYRRFLRERSTGFVLPKLEPPSPVQSDEARVVVRAHLSPYTGYGQHAMWLGRCLEMKGIPAAFEDLGTDNNYLPIAGFVTDRIVPNPQDSWRLQLSPPDNPISDRPTIYFSMWESGRISQAAVANLNKAEAVLVPCQYNKHVFIDSGVTRPIHIVPMGFDPGEGYVPQAYVEGKPFTFGMAGRMAHGGIRKGLNEGAAAFVAAFPNGENVRLEIKVWEDCLPALHLPDDPRIVVVTTPMNPMQMAEWYGGLDCYFAPSKGEGWGLHSIQAMACGRPAIAAPHSGTTEFWDDRFGWNLPYTMGPAEEFYTGLGDWAIPTHDGMVKALRYAFAHRDECRTKGERAAIRALEFTWSRSADRLYEVLVSLGRISRGDSSTRLSLAQYRDKQARRNACPSLGPPSECGCTNLNICLAGHGRGPGGGPGNDVSTEDCFACPDLPTTSAQKNRERV